MQSGRKQSIIRGVWDYERGVLAAGKAGVVVLCCLFYFRLRGALPWRWERSGCVVVIRGGSAGSRKPVLAGVRLLGALWTLA